MPSNCLVNLGKTSLALGVAALLAACDHKPQTELERQQAGDRSGAIGSADPLLQNGQQLPPGTQFARAEAKFHAPADGKGGGHAKLEEITSGVRIQVTITGAPANRDLGVHVYEQADCGDFTAHALGDHFNPRHVAHGMPDQPEHHLGDLGNVHTDDHGNAELLMLTSGGNLKKGDPLSFVGHALAVDEAADAGAAGAGSGAKKLACGTIEAS
jgi:Cu-Zn family superoxide dismutase